MNFSPYFEKGNQIKALIPYGKSLKELKHLVCDDKGNVVFEPIEK